MAISTQDEWELVATRGRAHPVVAIDLVCLSFIAGAQGKMSTEYAPRSYRQLSAGQENARFMKASDVRDYLFALRKVEEGKPGSLLESAKENARQSALARRTADRVNALNVSPASSWKELAEGWRLFGEAFERLTLRTYHYVMLNRFYSDLLGSALARRVADPQEQARLSTLLFAASQPSGIKREKKALVELALEARENGWSLEGERVQRRLESIVGQFGYLGVYVMRGEPFSVPLMRERLSDLMEKDLELARVALENGERLSQETARLFDQLGFSPQERLMVRTVQEWAFAANDGDESYGYVTSRCLPLFNEIARRFRVPVHDVMELRYAEGLELLENEAAPDADLKARLERRETAHALLLEHGAITFHEGKDFEAYNARERKIVANEHHLRELKGQTASPGHAQGRVRLLRGVEDVPKLKHGEVLVAQMTMPAFVPAMEKAAAIVTDEGGLLCHAAIVSRELGVPCVVGTKKATRVFEDGDEVDVDATNGVVRKL